MTTNDLTAEEVKAFNRCVETLDEIYLTGRIKPDSVRIFNRMFVAMSEIADCHDFDLSCDVRVQTDKC